MCTDLLTLHLSAPVGWTRRTFWRTDWRSSCRLQCSKEQNCTGFEADVTLPHCGCGSLEDEKRSSSTARWLHKRYAPSAHSCIDVGTDSWRGCCWKKKAEGRWKRARHKGTVASGQPHPPSCAGVQLPLINTPLALPCFVLPLPLPFTPLAWERIRFVTPADHTEKSTQNGLKQDRQR